MGGGTTIIERKCFVMFRNVSILFHTVPRLPNLCLYNVLWIFCNDYLYYKNCDLRQFTGVRYTYIIRAREATRRVFNFIKNLFGFLQFLHLLKNLSKMALYAFVRPFFTLVLRIEKFVFVFGL